MSWTDERVETLKELWTSGLSASQIARKMGGVTRNAVIGKVHRLGLSGRAKPMRVSTAQIGREQIGSDSQMGNHNADAIAPPNKKERAAANVGVHTPPAAAKSMLTPEQRASVLHLNEHTCKWPIGDPGETDFHFCGARAKMGSPYCDVHAALAYQPLERKRRKASSR